MEDKKSQAVKSKPIAIGMAFALLAILPQILGPGDLSLVNEMLILGVAASGLNLMMGYAGMVSFGPAGLYVVGAYTMALLLFYTELPFGIALVAAPVIAGIVSLVVGWFCVRLTHVYFSLLTLAFSQIIHTIIFEWYGFTKGDDGIVDIRVPGFIDSITNYYYFTLIIAGISLALIWMIVKSPFGKTLQAIRENPDRTEFIGIHVRSYQLAAFVLSGVFLGVAGALYCGFSHSVFPDFGDIMKSTEILVVCLLGGIYHFLGPMVGAVVYMFLDKTISSYTEYWPLVLGVVIVLLVIFLRGGIVGFVTEKIAMAKQRKTAEAEDYVSS
ncbi:MAG: branched-chain amino acid ABC transporter permease [Deltaproteobacteria bacterium]|nr:branched-chain amino acid ABC transporter permease [Deltaproteobacteria bacterium]